MHFLPNSNSGKDFKIFMGIDIYRYIFFLNVYRDNYHR